MRKDTADRLSFGFKNRLRALIAVSVPETARTVVRSIETVSLLMRAPVLYLEEKMTSKTNEIFIGIDISKATLDIAIWGSEEYWQIENNPPELHRLSKRLNDLSPSLVVVEASGGLEQPVVRELSKKNLPVAMVNPTRVRCFARSTGQLAKTDKLDAKIIAQFAQAVKPKVKPLRTLQQEHLDALVTRRRQIIDTMMMIGQCNSEMRKRSPDFTPVFTV